MGLIINPNEPVREEDENIPVSASVRFVGEVAIDVIPPMLIIKAGITEANRLEFYMSDTTGEWMVKFMPLHEFEERGWRTRRRNNPEANEPEPYRTTYTDHGLMIRISQLPEEDLKDVLFGIVLKDFSIFPEREKDEWDW